MIQRALLKTAIYLIINHELWMQYDFRTYTFRMINYLNIIFLFPFPIYSECNLNKDLSSSLSTGLPNHGLLLLWKYVCIANERSSYINVFYQN